MTLTRRALRNARILSLVLASLVAGGCGVHRRVLGIFGDDATVLVRHTRAAPQEIRASGTLLGTAPSNAITCFIDAPTGNVRLEAFPVGGGSLTRAVTVVLTDERSILWDLDHLEVLDGRAHETLCD